MAKGYAANFAKKMLLNCNTLNPKDSGHVQFISDVFFFFAIIIFGQISDKISDIVIKVGKMPFNTTATCLLINPQ